MFDGTYPVDSERRADTTDKRRHKHDDERNPIIIKNNMPTWEEAAHPIPTVEELAATQPDHVVTEPTLSWQNQQRKFLGLPPLE